MCKVTPREVIERQVMEYRARVAAEEAERKARAGAEALEKVKTAPTPKTGGANRPRSGARDNRVERCRGYLKTIRRSVDGVDGSGSMIQAARIIWNDFGIDDADGLALLEEYNLSASPPWEADGKDGYLRKWNEAVAKGPGPEGRGFRLEQDRPDWEPKRPPGAGARTADRGADRPPVVPRAPTAGGLPDIIHNKRQYRDVEADAFRALVLANEPPTVFVGNGCGLVDLQRGDPESPLAARELDGPAMRGVFARCANWFRDAGEDGIQDDYPPPALLASFPARGQWPGLPFLRSVVTYPVFGPGWVLTAEQGYHPRSGIFCDLGELVVPGVYDTPTAENVTAARELIVTELLGDFPFVDQASRANAVAMLLLPVTRHAIAGPTPLGVIDAPTEGTGKSLLAEVVTLTTVGEIPEAVSPDVPDEEWNKMLLAMLIEGLPVIYLDNANRKLDSGAFASALTATFKRGRVLGETKIARARINVCWLLTANNFECSREIARRVYWSRIDRGVENPSEEHGFRHPDLLGWVRENRPRLLAAVITLVCNWLAKGKPAGSATLGKFEVWAAAVGGILEAAGIEGLLGNADEFRKLTTTQASEMPEFLGKWYEKHLSTRVIANDLYDCADGVLESVLTAKEERGRRTQLGNFLRKQRDKVYGEYRIKFAMKPDGEEDKDYAGRARYCLQRVKGKKATDAPAQEYADGDGEFDMVG